MKKEFLDYLYYWHYFYLSQINALNQEKHHVDCNKNISEEEKETKFKATKEGKVPYQSKMEALSESIKKYIKIHSGNPKE